MSNMPGHDLVDRVERRPHARARLQPVPPRGRKRTQVLAAELLLAPRQLRHHVVALCLRLAIAVCRLLCQRREIVPDEMAAQFARPLPVLRLLPSAERLRRSRGQSRIRAERVQQAVRRRAAPCTRDSTPAPRDRSLPGSSRTCPIGKACALAATGRRVNSILPSNAGVSGAIGRRKFPGAGGACCVDWAAARPSHSGAERRRRTLDCLPWGMPRQDLSPPPAGPRTPRPASPFPLPPRTTKFRFAGASIFEPFASRIVNRRCRSFHAMFTRMNSPLR